MKEWHGGVVDLGLRLKQWKLRWFIRVRRRKEGNIVKMVEEIEVERYRMQGRNRKAWRSCVSLYDREVY